jgi:glucose/mannose transport system permease protein
MALRWSRLSPQLALIPAVTVALVAFAGAIGWTIVIGFTESRRFPEYSFEEGRLWRQYTRLFGDENWYESLSNVGFLAVGSALAILLGFVLAAMVEHEKRAEGFFRTIFLYPLAVSFIVTGIIWRWMFNPALGIEHFLHSIGWESANFNWLADKYTAMYGIILASIWHGLGFYMALMLAGLKSINSEIWAAARLDGVHFLKLYVRVIIPMLKFTFLTCAILLSLGVVKTYDIVLAMTGGGPGNSTWTPAYFVMNAYSTRGNLGYAAAAAVLMLLMTVLIFLPLVMINAWAARRREARVT